VLAFNIASADVIMLGIANLHNQAPILPEGLYCSPFNSQDEDCVTLFFTACLLQFAGINRASAI